MNQIILETGIRGNFMSEHEADELNEKLQRISEIKLGPLIKCVWGLVIGAFVIGGWVAKLEVQSHTTSAALEMHAKSDMEMMLWKAGTESSRFTASDWNRANQTIQDSLINHDKRLTRTEDTLSRVDATLMRIETKLGTRQ